jgi:hypothetical protein
VSLVYVVSAHRDPWQVARLVRRLEHEDTHVLLHLDRRAGRGFARDVERELAGAPRVHRLRRRRVRWGRWSVIAPALDAIRALPTLGLDPHHAVFLTGQCYPIKPPGEIARRLAAAGETSFLEAIPLPVARWSGRGGLDRIEYVWVYVPRRGPRRTPLRRTPPSELRFHGASQHANLSRTALAEIRRVAGARPDLIRFFRLTGVPDELFLQTLLMSSPERDRVVSDDLRFIRWPEPAWRPLVLGLEHLDELRSSGALFARKFEDPKVLDAIDRELLDG